MSRPGVLAVFVLVLTAAPVAAQPRNSTLGSLPATYSGVLPCPDCIGIRTQINLLPGGAYMQRTTWLLSGHDDSRYQIGAWSLSRDGRTLSLRDEHDETTAWAVQDSRTLRKLDRESRPIDSKLPYDLTRRPALEPIEPRVQLSGMFRHAADAPRFRDCCSGMQWPVALSSDYQALERAYIARRAKPGSELMVTIDARIEPRARAGGAGSEPTLVVEKFQRSAPGEKCPEAPATNALAHTRWRPVRIGGLAVRLEPQQREPWIELDPRTMRVTGSGGCNRITGSYESDAATLRFGPIISTRMACPGLELETSFLRALDGTRRYRIRGRTLDLMDDRGTVLARLEETPAAR